VEIKEREIIALLQHFIERYFGNKSFRISGGFVNVFFLLLSVSKLIKNF